MEKYSEAVGGACPRSNRGEAHPLEKYMGRLAYFFGGVSEVVGYSHNGLAGGPLLIVDASRNGGWTALGPSDVVFRECERYWYVGVNDLMG